LIDIVVLTKDSEESILQCLKSVCANVPVNKLIIIDGCSKDKTLRAVADFSSGFLPGSNKVEILQSRGTRGECRQLGISRITTDWFMFVDSDVVLCRNWFQKAQHLIKRSERTAACDAEGMPGAVWGIDLDVRTSKSAVIRKLLALVSALSFSARGGTHDLLVRTDAVKQIEIPRQLHTYEDAYIVNWIRRCGYKVLKDEEALFCFHFKPRSDWNLGRSIRQIPQELKCGLVLSRSYRLLFCIPVYILDWLVHKLSLFRRSDE
jgi:glycosyltransferase involved in cell wall biosynthesis